MMCYFFETRCISDCHQHIDRNAGHAVYKTYNSGLNTERRMTAVELWMLDRFRGLVEYDTGKSYESIREQLQTGRTQGLVSVTEGRGQRNQTQQTYPVNPAMLHV